MSTHCVIARRLAKNVIQYGCIICDGDLDAVGLRLIRWYNTPKRVEYLFSLGQLESLGGPGSENSGGIMATRKINPPCQHKICESENEMRPDIDFIDYYYIYESDGKWYYDNPDSVCKVPLLYSLYRLERLRNHPEELPKKYQSDRSDFPFRQENDRILLKYVFYENPKIDPEFKSLLESKQINVDDVYKQLCEMDFPIAKMNNDLKQIFRYFYPHFVFKTDSDGDRIVKILHRKVSEPRLETIEWE